MTAPDFIIIGAMKCGTSTLAAQLGAQPGLFMTDPKEPNYFSDDAVFAKGPDWYAGLFDAATLGDIRGEASTHYTKRPDYPETLPRMRAALQAPKLVYMIRDPMVRLVSHYIHLWSEGLSDPFEHAIEAVPSLVDYGRYGWQITPFVETWGADAICLTSLERLRADKTGELARIADHLGHEGQVLWVADVDQENASSGRIRKLPLHRILVDNPVARTLRRTLVPKALRTRIREARKMRDRPALPDTMRPGLEVRFAEDRALLASFFPDDPSLDAAYPWLG